jgi:SAM-dependent methyltransferase
VASRHTNQDPRRVAGPRPAQPAQRQRRALSHVGGAVDVEAADERDREPLGWALRVSSDEAAARAHVHGFHSYPARVHPITARRCVQTWARPGASVLDPFCGSGTILVEARLLGRKVFGVDLNPLAVELSWCKTRGSAAAERERLVELANRVADWAEERRLAKAGPTRRYGAEDRDMFDPHVLLELDGLANGLSRVEDPDAARMLRLVLSATLTKVSRRAADSSERVVDKRLASGFVIRLYRRKAWELAERLGAFAASVPPRTPKPDVRTGDARELTHLRPGSIDLIVSSPPYPGVYDYWAHHAARARWLGLADRALKTGEIGSRRQLGQLEPARAVRRWRTDFGAFLHQARRVLAPGGGVLLVMADTALHGVPIRADELLAELGPEHDLELCGRASQVRPDFHRPSARAFAGRPRREHLCLLRRR